MSSSEDITNPNFFPHRFVEGQDAILFLQADCDLHRKCTFITDEYLPKERAETVISVSEILERPIPPAQMHFIFHSAYCCSTLLARAFDMPGVSFGIKEPQILNDMLGWMRRGAGKEAVMPRLQLALDLLSRPFAPDEQIIVKPSNLVNPLSMMMLALRPDSKAILLFAPLDIYLRSIAKKNMWGRLWVRELLNGRIVDRTLVGNLSPQELLGLTDLQVAALGWLSDLRLFQELQRRLAPGRIMTLDSETLLGDKEEAMRRAYAHFSLPADSMAIADVINGPAFLTDSKNGQEFSVKKRQREYDQSFDRHSEEITMVTEWTKAMADHVGMPMHLD